MPSALAVAKCLFDSRKKAAGRDLNFVRIHKLVYFAYGLYFNRKPEPLVEEQLEAWQWGPIFPSLYYSLIGRNIAEVMGAAPSIEDAEVRHFIESLERALRGIPTLTLSTLAHEDGSPWHQAVTAKTGSKDTSVGYLQNHLPPGVAIEREAVRKWFEQLQGQGHGREDTR